MIEQDFRSKIELSRTSGLDEIKLVLATSAARNVESGIAQRASMQQQAIDFDLQWREFFATELRWRAKIDRSFERWIRNTQESLDAIRREHAAQAATAGSAMKYVRGRWQQLEQLEASQRSTIVGSRADWVEYIASQYRAQHEVARELELRPKTPAAVAVAVLPSRIQLCVVQERETRDQMLASEAQWRAQLRAQQTAQRALLMTDTFSGKAREISDREGIDRLQVALGEGKWRAHMLDHHFVAVARLAADHVQRGRHRATPMSPFSSKASYSSSTIVRPPVGGLKMTDPF